MKHLYLLYRVSIALQRAISYTLQLLKAAYGINFLQIQSKILNYGQQNRTS